MSNPITFEMALSKSMAICSKAEKCSYDIQQKLYEWGLNTADSARIIQKLIADKYIDEERYARFFVRDKFRFNLWGRIKIVYMLKGKRIPSDLIVNALEELDDEEYFQKLSEMMKSKNKSIKSDNVYERKAKLFRFAQGKGFETDLIEKALTPLLKS